MVKSTQTADLYLIREAFGVVGVYERQVMRFEMNMQALGLKVARQSLITEYFEAA
jgi:hypothetical protein